MIYFESRFTGERASWPTTTQPGGFQPFLSRGTLTWLYQYLVAPIIEELELLFYKLRNLAAPLAALHGTPVRIHFKDLTYALMSGI